MKKRTSPIAIVAAIIAVIVIILVFVGMNRHKDDANHQNNESVTSSAESESDGSDMASAETASGIDNSDISTSLPGNIGKEVLESDDTKDSERAKANVVAGRKRRFFRRVLV